MTFKKKFTFHYVSTYTTKLPNPHKLIFSFTFHYVSTYTSRVRFTRVPSL